MSHFDNTKLQQAQASKMVYSSVFDPKGVSGSGFRVAGCVRFLLRRNDKNCEATANCH